MQVINKTVAAVAIAAAFFALVPSAWASDTDALLNKLVEKRILTVEEAQEVRNEMAADAKPQADVREVEIKEVVKKMSGGSWLDKVKWGGDFRLRHETQMRQPAVNRNRERFRLRFGFTAKPWDPLEVGVRLASGASGDPLSTNQSFTATFDKKAIFIDKAYAKYTPFMASTTPLSGLSMTGGKMENPFVTTPEGIVWDSDVTPEGVAIQWKDPDALPILQKWFAVKPFVNVGAFQISELSADEGDPSLFGYQGGVDMDLPWGIGFQPSVTYYDFVGIKGIATSNVTGAPAGNSTLAPSKFANDYNLVSTQGKLTFPNILGQPVALLADYTYNNFKNVSAGATEDAVDDGGAYTYGAEIGKVTEKFGSWKAFFFHKRVEPDSTFGALTDSDFGGGGTNHKGYVMGLQLGLNKWATAGVKYFRTDEIEGAQNKNDTFQADLVLKY